MMLPVLARGAIIISPLLCGNLKGNVKGISETQIYSMFVLKAKRRDVYSGDYLQRPGGRSSAKVGDGWLRVYDKLSLPLT
jgi:hypothetical protein